MTIPTALWRWRSKSRRISTFESWPGFSLWTLRDQLEAKPIHQIPSKTYLLDILQSLSKMEGIANNKCKWLDRSNALDLLRCQAAIVIGKSENGQALVDLELLSRVLLARRINLYQEPLILTFIGRANQFVQTTFQLNLQKIYFC